MSKKNKKKNTNGEKKSPGKKNHQPIAIVLVVVVVSVAAGFLFAGKGGPVYPNAFGGEARKVMSPNYFIGKTAKAYRVAQAIPQVLDKVYCYCKCQENYGHKSLLTCFVDRHGSQCGICMDEALMADKLYKKGYSIEKIVKEVNSRFSSSLKNS